MSNHDGQHGDHHGEKHDSHPPSYYIKIWGILLVLLVVSICGPMIGIRAVTLFTAFGIAIVKAVIVAAEFMHLKVEKRLISYLLGSMLLLMFLFFFAVAPDVMTAGGQNWERPSVDEEHGHEANALAVHKHEAEEGPVDVAKLVQQAPSLASKGQAIFAQQCVSCHGANGHGDGAASATLNPKPRNFTQGDGWKNGRKLTQIFKTITTGIPGSAMAPFTSLSSEERFALASYVQSLGPKAPADVQADIAALQQSLGAVAKPQIPIAIALEIMAREWETTHK